MITMSAQELFTTLKHPESVTLSRDKLSQALAALLHVPPPPSLVDETFQACSNKGDDGVTLESFVRFLQTREQQLKAEFDRLDTDRSGSIDFSELIKAQETGVLKAHKRELTAVLQAMDRVSKGVNQTHSDDRMIQWEEFRAMMILLPPATTIQTIVDLVKKTIEPPKNDLDRELSDFMRNHFSFAETDLHLPGFIEGAVDDGADSSEPSPSASTSSSSSSLNTTKPLTNRPSLLNPGRGRGDSGRSMMATMAGARETTLEQQRGQTLSPIGEGMFLDDAELDMLFTVMDDQSFTQSMRGLGTVLRDW